MFSNGAYLKVWEIKNKAEKYTDVRATTSRKKEDGTYEQDFNGFVRLVGNAHQQGVNEGDSVQIENCGVKQVYDKEKKKTFTNFMVFAFKNGNAGNSSGKSGSKSPQPKTDSFNNIPNGVEEELPF